MLLETKHFGEISYEQDEVITFEEGLPGFRDNKTYLLLADKQGDLFNWLQSTDNGDLAFVLMDVKQILPEYNPEIDPEMTADLEEGGFSCYNIAVVPDDVKQMRVNLRAPVVINKARQKGRQVVTSNEEDSVRYHIFEELSSRQQQESQAVCG